MERTRTHKRYFLALSCGIFGTLGMSAAAFGPALPDFARNTASSLEAVGAFFTLLFLGSLVTQLLSGTLLDRLGPRPVLLAALAFLAVGQTGMVFSTSLIAALLFVAMIGAGAGLALVVINVEIAALFPTRAASTLNMVNIFFPLGAVAGPALAGVSLRAWGSALPVLLLGAGLLFLALLLLLPLKLAPRPQSPSQTEKPPTNVYRSPALWVLGCSLLLYVGIEQGTGGWTTAYISRSTTLGPDTAALLTSGFWLALMLGRAAGGALGLVWAPDRVMIGGLATGVGGALIFALSTGNALLTAIGLLLFGFGLGPVYPTTIALITASFRQAPGRAVSIVTALGSLGGTSMPWLQGVILERSGPGASAYYTMGVALALLLFFSGATLLLAKYRGSRVRVVPASPLPRGEKVS